LVLASGIQNIRFTISVKPVKDVSAVSRAVDTGVLDNPALAVS
jgi:hypothetical protein